MGYWETLVTKSAYSPYAPRDQKLRSNAIAAQYPEYEQSSPQYPTPNPYSLAQAGYTANTLIYACINKRMSAISAAPMWIYNTAHEIPTVVKNMRVQKLLKTPNERMSERQFWQATEMYLDIAGFAAWEIERNNLGEPIHLWPMRPDWCSFMRGNGRPIRAIRYAPWGLPPQDIPIDSVLLFQYFHPLYPMLKGYSPTMAALKDIGVDNGMSNFLLSFIMQGARFSGLLTTDQDLDDIEAERIKQRWKTMHGGTENWNDIAVLGHGTTYQNTSMSFDEMAFPELDGRTESRICMAFGIPPMLLGAKVGLNASTHTNYEQARKAWYEEWVVPQWAFLSEQFGTQMLREDADDGGYKINPHLACEFMTKKITALQENRDLAFRRAISAARSNVFYRDQALAEIGMDPVDRKPVYVGDVSKLDPNEPDPVANDDGNPEVSNAALENEETSNDMEPMRVAAAAAERKQFKAFVAKRIREDKYEDILQFNWRYTPVKERIQLLAEFVKA